MNLLKNTNLLSHCSVGQKSGHNVAGLCAQGLTRLDQVWTGLRFHLSLGVLLQTHASRWQNSVPCACRTDVPIISPTVSERPRSGSGGCSWGLDTWVSPQCVTFLLQGQQANPWLQTSLIHFQGPLHYNRPILDHLPSDDSQLPYTDDT